MIQQRRFTKEFEDEAVRLALTSGRTSAHGGDHEVRHAQRHSRHCPAAKGRLPLGQSYHGLRPDRVTTDGTAPIRGRSGSGTEPALISITEIEQDTAGADRSDSLHNVKFI
jgi:hypothetical protein